MAKKDESSKQLATLMQSSVGTDVSVSMDDVVNVFVSQYETKLHERKNELSQQMRDAKKELEDFVKAVIDAIFPKYEKYTTENEVIGVRSYISKDVDICWTDEKKGPHAKMSLVIEDMDEDGKRDRYCSNSFEKPITHPLKASDIKRHNALKSAIESLNTDMAEVITGIQSVSRKERQIRGKIAAEKLQASGYDALMQSPELLKLIAVD